MLYLFILIAFNASCLHAMDVDTEPTPKNRKRERENVSTIAPTSSSASSALTDIFILTDQQKQFCEWAISETKEQVEELKKYGPLEYPYGTFDTAHPEKKERINLKAKNVTENRNILEQNMLIRIANEMALRLHGTSKTEYPGDDAAQTKRLQQAQDNLAKLTKINDHLYTNCTQPTQPLKKQKRQ